MEFREAIAYALLYVGRQVLTLKPKQEEALFHLYDGRDALLGSQLPIYGKSLGYLLLPFITSN